MSNVMACIDGSPSSRAVCDCALWATQRLDAPLTFLHVLDRNQYPADTNLAGNIGLGTREHLLNELAALDEQRSKLAMKQGRHLLEDARERAAGAGINEVRVLQRHGSLVDTLRELEDDIRLVVIGKQGQDSEDLGHHIGSQLESVVRTLHRPILVTPPEFEAPRSVLFAFDGSPTTRKGVELLAARPLVKGLPIHLVMIGAQTGDAEAQLEWARQHLAEAGFDVHTAIRAGEVEETLLAYQAEQDLDLIVMGAYGHSRIRQFLVGSTTANMIRHIGTPMLLLR